MRSAGRLTGGRRQRVPHPPPASCRSSSRRRERRERSRSEDAQSHSRFAAVVFFFRLLFSPNQLHLPVAMPRRCRRRKPRGAAGCRYGTRSRFAGGTRRRRSRRGPRDLRADRALCRDIDVPPEAPPCMENWRATSGLHGSEPSRCGCGAFWCGGCGGCGGPARASREGGAMAARRGGDYDYPGDRSRK